MSGRWPVPSTMDPLTCRLAMSFYFALAICSFVFNHTSPTTRLQPRVSNHPLHSLHYRPLQEGRSLEFADQRFGEREDGISAEEKAMLRFRKVRQRKSAKVGLVIVLFNPCLYCFF